MHSTTSLVLAVVLSILAGIGVGFIFVAYCPFLQNMLIDFNECYFVIPG